MLIFMCVPPWEDGLRYADEVFPSAAGRVLQPETSTTTVFQEKPVEVSVNICGCWGQSDGPDRSRTMNEHPRTL
ncbi:hypothetical protein [Streptomyces atroolivaceus]|uniref:hypothetical protein n=1 Tax=Streptomyces atroolivaceus TaxID=66869 RepID=UPI00202416AC|nr:hypothetical protein [Streptomyces atroolivaceus]